MICTRFVCVLKILFDITIRQKVNKYHNAVTAMDTYQIILWSLVTVTIIGVVSVYSPLYSWDCDEQHEFITNLCKDGKVQTSILLSGEVLIITSAIAIATTFSLVRMVG